MRILKLCICSMMLGALFALAGGAWEPAGEAKTNDEATSSAGTRLGPAAAIAGLESFQATRSADGRTEVAWRASESADLAFRLYREQNGARERVSPLLAAGTMPSGDTPSTAPAGSYTWWDKTAPRHGAVTYWLEELNGKRQRKWHGPLVLVAREPRVP